MKRLAILIAALTIVSGIAVHAASPPAAGPDAQRTAVLQKLRASKDYIAAMKEVQGKQAARDAVDANDEATSDERATASMDLINAKRKVLDMEAKALKDAGVSGAATQPATAPTQQMHWAVKDGAPPFAQDILDTIAATKEAVIAKIDQQIANIDQPIKPGAGGNANFGGASGPVVVGQNQNSTMFASGSSSSAVIDNPAWAIKLNREKKGMLDDLNRERKMILDDQLWLPSEIPLNFAVGAIGIIPAAQVDQVIDRNNVRASVDDIDFWLKGVDTSNLVDDKTYAFGQLVRVSGTKQYETLNGAARTVYVVEPIDFTKFIVAVTGPASQTPATRPVATVAASVADPIADLPPLATPTAQTAVLSAATLFQKSAPSVVLVQCGDDSGTAVCVAPDGILITSLHVVSNGDQIEVIPFEIQGGNAHRMHSLTAQLVARSEQDDLAILKVADPPPSMKPLMVATQSPGVGDTVFAVGNPGLGENTLDLSISNGIVSSANRAIDNNVYIQHTAAVNPGNSGGPLLDESGSIVALVCLKAKLEGVSFATPAKTIREFSDQYTAKPAK